MKKMVKCGRVPQPPPPPKNFIIAPDYSYNGIKSLTTPDN